ncbi:MAG TPA: nucleotidyltransferase domain-containing protein [Longimicrobiaceae bacterium]|nr:nucleotidyltransferase domain-containing protein [Longimicrobiaceae bacterium]
MTAERLQADELAGRLRDLFGDALVAVVLYGSAARGEYRPGGSDLNLLVITHHLGIDDLRRASALTREWVGEGNPPPLMLSEGEWLGSADVFPLEYSDIRDSHVLLAGRDPFEGVRIERRYLRHQLEHELRSKKIQLREAYLAAGEVPEELGGLIVQSLSSFLTLFRGALRVAGASIPRDAAALIGEAAAQIGFGESALLAVLEARDAGDPFPVHLDDPVARGYLEAVERSADWLDAFQPVESTREEV